jgi:hypothetical protein
MARKAGFDKLDSGAAVKPSWIPLQQDRHQKARAIPAKVRSGFASGILVKTRR